ncbi:MAG: metal-dependent hydrolase [Nitrososphaerales archaeon]
MNFTTHVMFGMLIGALFFGNLEIILLVGIGAAIPDMDREYGFFSRDVFRKHQLHRALCHNFVFLGILYLLNPFLALGAFLHTLLDSFTTAKDRGVEWLYPFSRLVKRAVYDHEGKRIMELDPKTMVYMYQNDPVELTRKSAEDLKDYTPRPWRRSYGPALSGGILDLGIFFGSGALLLLMVALSEFGVRNLIDLSPKALSLSSSVPLFIGSFGVLLVLVTGEIKRYREAKKASHNPTMLNKISYLLSLSLIAIGIFLGAYLNPSSIIVFASKLPYIIAGTLVVFTVAYVTLKIYSHKSATRIRNEGHPYSV